MIEKIPIVKKYSRFFKALVPGVLISGALLVLLPTCGRQGTSETLVVRITGQDYYWHFRFAGPDAVFQTADDIESEGDLHLPVGRPARLELTSQDYIYAFSLPSLGKKEIAVPDLFFYLDLKFAKPGQFDIRGDQMCGFSHESMYINLIVEPEAEFKSWLGERRANHQPPGQTVSARASEAATLGNGTIPN